MHTALPAAVSAPTIARPMPFVAPVTMAILFWRSMAGFSVDSLNHRVEERLHLVNFGSKAAYHSSYRAAGKFRLISIFLSAARSRLSDSLYPLRPSLPGQQKIQTTLLCRRGIVPAGSGWRS